MADILSYTNDRATRSRQDCLGELERESVHIIHEHGGVPVLQVVTKDVRTGRTFRIQLSREETKAVMRVMLRSGAMGMNTLRAHFKPYSSLETADTTAEAR